MSKKIDWFSLQSKFVLQIMFCKPGHSDSLSASNLVFEQYFWPMWRCMDIFNLYLLSYLDN